MGWANSVITDIGVAMLNQSLVGHVLTITHVVGGAGMLNPSELASAASVSEEKQTFTLLGIENVSGGKKIKIQITNEDSAEKYVLHQVAIFARLDNDSETSMLMIMQDDLGVEIPTVEETPDFIFELYVTIGISNIANIKVNVDSDSKVSVQYLKESIKAHNEDVSSHPYLLQMIRQACSNVLSQVGGIKKVIYFTIPAEGWHTLEDTANGYLYYYDLSDEEITGDMIPEVTLAEESLETAKRCGMCNTATAYDGYVRFKCTAAPSADITATCNLLVPAGSGEDITTILAIPIATETTVGGIKGSDTIQIDEDGTAHVVNAAGAGGIATDEEAKDAIDDAFDGEFISGDVATDDEVEDALDDIFNTEGNEIATDDEVAEVITDIFGEPPVNE